MKHNILFNNANKLTFGYITIVSLLFGFIMQFDMEVTSARLYLGIPGLTIGILGLIATYKEVSSKILNMILLSLFIYFPLSVYMLPVYPLGPLTQIVIVFPVAVLCYLEFKNKWVLSFIGLYSGLLYFYDLYLDYSNNNIVITETTKDMIQVYFITVVLVVIPFVVAGYLMKYSLILLNKVEKQNEYLNVANKSLIDASQRNSHDVRKHLANIKGLIELGIEDDGDYELFKSEIEKMDAAISLTNDTINQNLMTIKTIN